VKLQNSWKIINKNPSAMSSAPLETLREDDFVEYFLFPDIKACDIQLENEEDQLTTVQQKIQEIYKTFSKNYIWHRDSFKVHPRYKNFSLLTQHETGEGGKNKGNRMRTLHKEKIDNLHTLKSVLKPLIINSFVSR
jgi:SGT1 protein